MIEGRLRSLLLEELKEQGFAYRDVNEIFEQKVLEPVEVEIILKYLREMYSEKVATADILARSLIAAKRAFDPSLLIDLFENSDLNFHLKSGIGIALSYAKTDDISAWMKDRLLNRPFDNTNYSLLHGLFKKGGFIHVEEYMRFIKKIFDKYHNETILKSFAKYGNAEDMKFLQEAAEHADVQLKREINKVLKKKSGKV